VIEKKKEEKIKFKVGLITISDRASKGEYQTGDLSGAEMKELISNSPSLSI